MTCASVLNLANELLLCQSLRPVKLFWTQPSFLREPPNSIWSLQCVFDQLLSQRCVIFPELYFHYAFLELKIASPLLGQSQANSWFWHRQKSTAKPVLTQPLPASQVPHETILSTRPSSLECLYHTTLLLCC
jgi:hypothetical protein